MREEITIAAKLYECNDTAKKFFRDEYPEKIKFYKEAIGRVMKDHNCDTLQAVIKISKLPSMVDNGMAIMMFMSAAVDLIEKN